VKWMLSCKEITEICCDEDRKLSSIGKIKFWMHLGICKACASYKKQVELISLVMKKTIIERSVVDEKKVSDLEKEIIEKISKGA
jgi:hypothetical protein